MRTCQNAVGMAAAILAALPIAVAAHEGHGAHGWLQGALQPLLSLDHLMAGLLVLAVGALAFAYLGRAWSTRGDGARSERTG